MQELALKQISLWKLNPRKTFNFESLQELAESIRQNGVIQPIVVRPVNIDTEIDELINVHAEYVIVAGERRYRAAVIAEQQSVPAIVKDITREQALEIAIIENLQRDDISAIEEARAYRTYLEASKVTQTEFAQKIGVSQSHVANRLRLLKLPEDFQEKIISGEITPTDGRELESVLKNLGGLERVLQYQKNYGQWPISTCIKHAKDDFTRERQEQLEKERLRKKGAHAIGEKVAELKAEGVPAVAAADIDLTGYTELYYSQRCKACESCERRRVVVDAESHWQQDYCIDTDIYCPDMACNAEQVRIDKQTQDAERKKQTGEKAAKKRTQNKERFDFLDGLLQQAMIVSHPEARFVFEALTFGMRNTSEFSKVIQYVGWHRQEGEQDRDCVTRHLTNGKVADIFKAIVVVLLLRAEKEARKQDDPYKSYYPDVQSYVSYLKGRGFKVGGKLGAPKTTDIDHCRESNKCEETCEEKCHV